jgi:outer membrane protein
MKKILIASATTALLCMSTLHGDTLGGEVGYATWNTKLTGNIKKGISSFNFDNELGYGSHQTNGFLWAYIDHPLPLIPNLKIQKTNFSDNGTGALQTFKVFNCNLLNVGALSSSIDFDQIDVIPYYRILDNWVNLDLGLNFKIIDGDISMTDNTSTTATTDFTVVLPMLYAKARFDMPLTGLSVETDASYIGYDGNSFTDVKAGVVHESSIGLGATAGYRLQNITLDDIDDTYGKLDIKGIYAGLFFHF